MALETSIARGMKRLKARSLTAKVWFSFQPLALSFGGFCLRERHPLQVLLHLPHHLRSHRTRGDLNDATAEVHVDGPLRAWLEPFRAGTLLRVWSSLGGRRVLATRRKNTRFCSAPFAERPVAFPVLRGKLTPSSGVWEGTRTAFWQYSEQ